MTALERFYPIAESARMVETLVSSGVRLVQLRIKEAPLAYLRDQITRAACYCRQHQAQLVVNDYWQLALELGVDCVHLGQEDLRNADLQALRRSNVRFGISTHDHAELDRAIDRQPMYVALGPIWPTLLKVMPWAPQGIARITEWKRVIGNRPLVAIGGITAERAPACLRAGADCVAVVSDVVRQPDVPGRVKVWLKAVSLEQNT